MSSEMFETLEDDFKDLYESIKRRVEGRLMAVSGEEQKTMVREIDRDHGNALSLIRSMEAEIQKAPPYERTSLRSRLSTNKRSLDAVMARMQHASKDFNEIDDMESAQRSKLMQGTRALQRASDSVHRSRQIADETDEIGTNILGELDRQGDALERTRDRLVETQSALSKSGHILRGMAFRAMTSKLIMVVIIIAELGILAGVVYWKFFSGKPSKNKT